MTTTTEAAADRLTALERERDHYQRIASASKAEVERLRESLKQHQRLLTINSVRDAAKAAAPLWLEAADAAAQKGE